MTSVAPSNGSTSPRWDSRNQGFISPAQLQQWRQQQQRNATHEYPPSPPPAPQRESQEDVHPVPNRPAPPPASNPPTTGGHSRSMSAFSLFNRGRQSHEGTHDSGHPPPSGSAQPPAHRHDEFGAPQPSQQRGPSLDASSPPPASALNRASTSSYPTIMRTSTDSSSPALHPEIRSIVQLTVAHGRKVYYSGPLVRRVERQPDGQTPTKDDGWRDVWAQLGGTTLSVWDMKAIDEASKEGRQVPPTYVNVTDAVSGMYCDGCSCRPDPGHLCPKFVNVLGAVTVPATPTSPPKKYGNVLTLNTAGSNLLLFSCPSPGALMSWAAAVRLSAWEKSRLEEIYTAHLIRITLNDGRHWPTPLTHGRMEGWVGIRVAGQTDWKRMWMVVTAGGHSQDGSSVSSTDQTNPPGSPNAPSVLRKKRMSNLFSRDRSPQRTVAPTKPFIQLLASPKPKDRKKPLLTMRDLTQAFAVYPERPDLISRSTLMKMEGTLGDEDVGSSMKSRECWLLVMPEFEGANSRASEMLKWLIGIHDAFELYGRPHEYIWDPRDPRSMMFAYPIGPHRDLLFLDREFAEGLDVLDERTSSVRLQLQNILLDRMRNPGSGPGEPVPPSHDHAPVLPPLHEVQSQENQEAEQPQPRRERFSLPPLNFDGPLSGSNNGPPVPEKRVLTPITERSVRDTSRSLSGDNPLTGTSTGRPTTPSTVAENSEETGIIAGQPLTTSLVDTGPSSHADTGKRLGEDSHGVPPNARANSRLSHLTHGRAQSQASLTHSTAPQPANTNLPIQLTALLELPPVLPVPHKENFCVVTTQKFLIWNAMVAGLLSSSGLGRRSEVPSNLSLFVYQGLKPV
ncbi:hypothetical protein B0H21DRAFT_570068 [Amylocystis lapponica]|nr:hypothetical protein B0H21DRAFT_570068 [Amylocystis lapponica]